MCTLHGGGGRIDQCGHGGEESFEARYRGESCEQGGYREMDDQSWEIPGLEMLHSGKNSLSRCWSRPITDRWPQPDTIESDASYEDESPGRRYRKGHGKKKRSRTTI